MESLSISYSEIVKISRIYTRKTKILPNFFVQKATKLGGKEITIYCTMDLLLDFCEGFLLY
jgi:hypothetical protein